MPHIFYLCNKGPVTLNAKNFEMLQAFALVKKTISLNAITTSRFRFISTSTRFPEIVRSTWVISDGNEERERECSILAHALGRPVVIKRVVPSAFSVWIPSILQKLIIDFKHVGSSSSRYSEAKELPWYLTSPYKDTLYPPYPEFVIASGIDAMIGLIEVGKRSAGKSFTVHVGFSTIPFIHFDHIILANHEVHTSLARLGPFRLQKNFTEIFLPLAEVSPYDNKLPNPFAPCDEISKRPMVSLLIGGPTKECQWGREEGEKVIHNINTLVDVHNASVVISFLKRTPEWIRESLRRNIENISNISFLPKEIAYHTSLQFATHAVVTADAITSVAEAVAACKPTYILFSNTAVTPSMKQFHRSLRILGFTRALRPTRDSNVHGGDPFSLIGNHRPWAELKVPMDVELRRVAAVLENAREEKTVGRRLVEV